MAVRQAILYGSIAAVLSTVAVNYPGELATSPEGLENIAQWEKYATRTYLDGVGVPTIGVGSTRWFDGRAPRSSQTASVDEAARLFIRDVKEAEKCVKERMSGNLMPQKVFDSAVSLVYNVGCSGVTWNPKYNRQTNIRLQANAYNWTKVCYHLGDFIYSGGKRTQGLVNRRTAEQAYCLRGI
ncbi:endolysin [Pectobacterium phage Arno160]|uniref:Endolysin n=1 Tax=Pectobacterium phage Arno160 TaxID=2488835 RepID=A0A3G8F2G6_9CAUD|nr:endolysin [Pectobacterium phage Arno160]AZF88109.1 lysozyme [Pectobacterium phage Arno160]